MKINTGLNRFALLMTIIFVLLYLYFNYIKTDDTEKYEDIVPELPELNFNENKYIDFT